MHTRHSAAAASRTTTIQETKSNEKKLVLKLKEKEKPTIKWTEDTIDNENLGRRSSKRKHICSIYLFFNVINNYSLYYLLLGCCIFHKTRKFAESDSDESDSDTEIAKQEPPKKGRSPAYQRHHA